jgi:hypothetical protein
MSQKPIHLVVATPCYGGMLHQRYMQCVCLLMQYGNAHDIRITVELLGRESLITRGRNMLVSKFMDYETATHLLFIDSDIGFEIQQVLRMLLMDKDIVGGMYPLKVLEWDNEALARAQGGEPLDYAAMRFVGTPCNPPEREGAFVTAEYAGAGFLLIKREAIQRMFETYPELHYVAAHNSSDPYLSRHQYALFDCGIDEETREYLSEDYAFCRRWRKIGGKIWLDTDSRLVHIGVHEFYAPARIRYPQEEPVATPEPQALAG